MDVYYRRLMGNGSVASKFKLDNKAYSDRAEQSEQSEQEPQDALSPSSCARCHRMKMRCTRAIPSCENCRRREVSCEYTRRDSGNRAYNDTTADPERTVENVHVTGTTGTHHSSCVRCYKSKKKCSRTFPTCEACQKASTECQYVERRRKRAKTEASGAPAADLENGESGEPNATENGVAEAGEASDTEAAEHEAPEHESGEEDAEAEANATVSEPSASGAGAANVAADGSETFRNIDLPVYVQNEAGPVPANARRPQRQSLSVPQKVVSSAIPSHSSGNIEEEFLVVRPIKDASLPSLFLHTFFANYEWRYPFLSRPAYIQKLQGISFVNETFVQLDIYLVLAIGCLIYDTNYSTSHYEEYFSDSLIESMVDIISYDIKSEEDLHKAHLLILLSIYAINVSNLNLIWNIVGFLNRLMVFMTDFSGRSETCMRKRCFWTIFNLDKELSLVLNKLSQFIPTKIIRLSTDFADTLHDGEPAAIGTLMTSAVSLHMLQDRMLSLKMGLVDKSQQVLTTFSADLEAWRVSISSLIHKEYSESPLLPNFIGLVNLDYYYLLIELDQLSATDSLQFTLQFLSNSFSLLLQESTEKKQADATSTYSLFWFVKFFKVIDYSVDSLPRILCPKLNKADLSLRLNEFNSNSHLIVNLLKFLLNRELKPVRFVERLEVYVEKLRVINTRLATFNPLVASGESIKALGESLVAEFESPST